LKKVAKVQKVVKTGKEERPHLGALSSRIPDGRGEVLHVKKEVDPILEIAGIQKSLDGGPAVLFGDIKGYPILQCREYFKPTGEDC